MEREKIRREARQQSMLSGNRTENSVSSLMIIGERYILYEIITYIYNTQI